MRYKLLWLCFGFFLFFNFQEISWSIGHYYRTQTSVFEFLSGKRLLHYPWNLLIWTICSVLSYSIFYLLFYRYEKKVLAIAAYLVIGIPLMIGLRYLIQEVILFSIYGVHNYSEDMLRPVRYFIDNIYFTIYYSVFGVVFFFVQLVIYHQKRQNELLVRSRQAELSFLRSQINPHFLFNSLNNVYTLVYQKSEKALPSINKLSELLRYMLYEKEEKVPLVKEVEYLKNFISLQQMRYDYTPNLQVDLKDAHCSTLNIIHLSLIPFVENAFKHGDLSDIRHPLSIILKLNERRLCFTVVNKISSFNKDETGGIGLKNIRKRLELLYAGKHSLKLEYGPVLFKVILTIELDD